MAPVTALSVRLETGAAIDAPFKEAYAAVASTAPAAPTPAGLVEYGLGGLRDVPPSEPGAAAISAWLPGDAPRQRLDMINAWQDAGIRFRFFFPERYHAPSVEARSLFTGSDLGARAHLVIRVAAHPERLLEPAGRDAPLGWLGEPVLNRLPLAVWMMGPVADVRVLDSSRNGARAVVVLLRHEHPARMSVLEMTISAELTEGGRPAVRDGFECTGSDGFLRVNGIWQKALCAPRLELHRGPLETVRRDLPRAFSAVFERAAAELPRLRRQSRRSYALATNYLQACKRITAR